MLLTSKMKVGVLPRVPLYQGVMSAADGLAWNEEDAGATPATLTISGRQADTSWLHLSRKQDRHRAEVGALPTPSANLFPSTINSQPTTNYETHSPLSKSVALPQELQTKSCSPHQTNNEITFRFSPRALWIKTKNQNCPVA